MAHEQPSIVTPLQDVDELHLVIASQREVIAELQQQHQRDQARIDALSNELASALRGT